MSAGSKHEAHRPRVAALAALLLAVIGVPLALATPTQAAPSVAAPLCGGAVATIVGTEGNDKLTGTPGDDVIAGLGGKDDIHGFDGRDLICGGDGDDILDGGNSADLLRGGAGNDTLDGAASIDLVAYDESPRGVTVDLAKGIADGDGHDFLFQFEDVIGSQFADVLSGNANDNTLNGRNGNDVLLGAAGNDSLSGQGESAAESNTLVGGPGNDLLNGGVGNDTASFSGAPAIFVDLAAGVARLDGNDTLVSIDTVLGTNGADTIVGDDRRNVVLALGGADVVRAGGGDDVVVGGAGNDSLDGGADTDTASFADTVTPVSASLGLQSASGAGEDSLAGFEGLLGGFGNDTLVGGFADDTLDGGPGNDALDGSSGSDTATFESSGLPVTADLQAGKAAGAGADTTVRVENLRGSLAPGDVLRGDGGANRLVAGPSDTLEGRAGDDVFEGPSDGTVTLSFGSAPGPVTADLTAGRASGATGNDTIRFLPGVLRGGNAADRLSCSTGPHPCTVDARGGNDIIAGSAADDLLRGGAGNDRSSGRGGFDAALFDTGGAVVVNLAGGTATGQGSDTLTGFRSVVGSPGNDTISGPATAPCLLSGEGGNDRVSTPGAACTLEGGAGNDTLTGSIGDDLLAPDEGDDTATAGAGTDVVVGSLGDDHLDGGSGVDLLDYGFAGPDVQADLATGLVTGWGTARATAFENFTGGGGNDTIRGTDGPNHILGLTGNDTIFSGGGRDVVLADEGDDVVEGGAGVDVLEGGEGIDTVSYASAPSGVVADLAAEEATGGAGSDFLDQFEFLAGSAFNDVLRGDAGNNVIDGRAGVDVCEGGGGADTLFNCP